MRNYGKILSRYASSVLGVVDKVMKTTELIMKQKQGNEIFITIMKLLVSPRAQHGLRLHQLLCMCHINTVETNRLF